MKCPHQAARGKTTGLLQVDRENTGLSGLPTSIVGLCAEGILKLPLPTGICGLCGNTVTGEMLWAKSGLPGDAQVLPGDTIILPGDESALPGEAGDLPGEVGAFTADPGDAGETKLMLLGLF